MRMRIFARVRFEVSVRMRMRVDVYWVAQVVVSSCAGMRNGTSIRGSVFGCVCVFRHALAAGPERLHVCASVRPPPSHNHTNIDMDADTNADTDAVTDA